MKQKTWNVDLVERELNIAFSKNSEAKLLAILKSNSFLFYQLYSRKYGIQPLFHEISFGGKYRCDFAWLNDNSDGPEWTLVEIERPCMRIFTKKNKPSNLLLGAIEQVKDWDRYFTENSSEKRRIFGAVAKFKYIIVAGDIASWSSEEAIKWRNQNNEQSKFQVRSSNIFHEAVSLIRSHPDEFWSFRENRISKPSTALETYWKSSGYMTKMRTLF